MHSTNRLLAAALAAALAATSCATGPENVENDFGNSVRHMVQSQSANPAAPADAKAIEGGDGARSNTVFEAYRKDVGNPQDVKQGIVINVGGK